MNTFARYKSGFRLNPVKVFLVALFAALAVFLVAVPYSGAVASAVQIDPIPTANP